MYRILDSSLSQVCLNNNNMITYMSDERPHIHNHINMPNQADLPSMDPVDSKEAKSVLLYASSITNGSAIL